MKKGMFFTLDALFALALAFALAGFIFFKFTDTTYPAEILLGQDILEIAYTQKILNDELALEVLLETGLPQNLCGTIQRYSTELIEEFNISTCAEQKKQRGIIRKSDTSGMIELQLWQK